MDHHRALAVLNSDFRTTVAGPLELMRPEVEAITDLGTGGNMNVPVAAIIMRNRFAFPNKAD
jgi:hypothetical protein